MLTLYVKAYVLPKLYLKARMKAVSDRGATAVEYGLIIALIAAVIAATVALLGRNLDSLFGKVDQCVSTAGKTCPAPPGS